MSEVDKKNWQLRVVPNLFPIFPEQEPELTKVDPDRQLISGLHEVVIESPHHDLNPASMSAAEISLVLTAWRLRFSQLGNISRLKYFTVFKNFGEAAGASLAHPHSQILATERIPPEFQRRLRRLRRIYTRTGKSWFQHLLDLGAQNPLFILETKFFVTTMAFAPRLPNEIWILPKTAVPSLDQISDGERDDLASHLERLLHAQHAALADPDFNLIVQTLPPHGRPAPHFSWHIQLIPRSSTFGGFELASGATVVTEKPEKVAAQLRASLPVIRA